MLIRRICFVALALGGTFAAGMARAADAANPPPVVGSDVMGDKSRSVPDGWAWAPVTRDQAPSAPAAGQNGAKSNVPPNAQPASNESKALPPGQDPGTPMASGSDGPGALQNPASASKP